MYVEVFLLDNLLINLLIARLAAALLSVRPPTPRLMGACSLSALIAALAAYLLPAAGNMLFKLPLLVLMAAAVPFRSIRGFVSALGATLLATLAVGGLTLAAALLFGGRGTLSGSGLPLRAALVSAAAASFLPRAAGRLLLRRTQNAQLAEVVVFHGGIVRRFCGVVDTGNTLTEPVSGLPVIVLRCRALEGAAGMKLAVKTAAGSALLPCFIPERIIVGGRETACAVALTDKRLSAEALVPPVLMGPKL